MGTGVNNHDKNKGAFQAFLLSMVLVLFASQAQARITFEALGENLKLRDS